MKRFIHAIICLALLAAAPIAGRAQDAKPKPARADAVQQAVLATVHILTGAMDAASGEFEGKGSGSGVIISPEGLVLTARHVVFQKNVPAREVWAGLVDGRNPRLPPTRVKRMKIVAEDAALDLALLRIESKRGGESAERFPFLRLATSDDLVFGSPLSVVGFPAAGGATTTVTSVNVVGFDARQGWIKVEGSVMQGASGGAAVNERGELVGIASQVAADRVLKPGNYLVKIVHPDYKPLFRRVDIGKEQQTLEIRLNRE